VNAVEILLFLALPLPTGATPSDFCPHLAPTHQHQRDANKDAKSKVEAGRARSHIDCLIPSEHPSDAEENRSPEWRGKGEM
jgi:hypothetical protein